MLTKEFTMLVIVAFIISAPIAYYIMSRWLDEFAYHINIGLVTCLGTLIILIVISWFTVGYRILSAAKSNPVKALRDE